jgi:hypothetical protein
MIILSAMLLIPATGRSDTIRVPADYPTIQDAIDFATKGDLVLVGPGTYMESIQFHQKNIVVQSELGPYLTVIDGGRKGSTVLMRNGGIDMTLDGFTVTNGTGDTTTSIRGGGIYASKATIINNIITRNVADYGAGIYGGKVILKNNLIHGNAAYEWGGGFYCSDGAVIEENLVYNNTAIHGAGGYMGLYGGAEINNNVITDNHALERGGGLFFDGWGGTPVVTNNIIMKNSAEKGGGLFGRFADPFFSNNTVYGNKASYRGGGLYVLGYIKLNNMIFWKNAAPEGKELCVGGGFADSETLIIRHSCVMGGKASTWVELGCWLNWGPGMITDNPLFVDAGLGDFHLRFTSPCKDAGDNDKIYVLDDFENDPRVSNDIVDMGADEFHHHLYCMGKTAPGSRVELNLIGNPASETLLYIGSDILDPPYPTMYGEWYLQSPIITLPTGTIPSDGLIQLHERIPPGYPAPGSIPLQALISDKLTNLCKIEIED